MSDVSDNELEADNTGLEDYDPEMNGAVLLQRLFMLQTDFKDIVTDIADAAVDISENNIHKLLDEYTDSDSEAGLYSPISEQNI